MNRGRPFEPGNKFGRGRPPGSRNRKAQALQKVLDEYTPALLRKSLAMALQGDVPLLKMFMDRRLPKSSGAPVRIGRLPSATIEQISQSQQNVVDQVAAWNLSPEQAVQIASLLETNRRTIETQELSRRRIERLEGASKNDFESKAIVLAENLGMAPEPILALSAEDRQRVTPLMGTDGTITWEGFCYLRELGIFP
jgi:hypothetical protein